MAKTRKEPVEVLEQPTKPPPPLPDFLSGMPFEKCENCFYAGQNLSDLFIKCDLQFPPWVQLKGLPAVHKQSKCSFFTHRD